MVDASEAQHEYGINPVKTCEQGTVWRSNFLAVAHDQFKAMGAEALRALGQVSTYFIWSESIYSINLKLTFVCNYRDLKHEPISNCMRAITTSTKPGELPVWQALLAQNLLETLLKLNQNVSRFG